MGTLWAQKRFLSRRFRRKSTTLTVASFFRQFNAIGPLFVHVYNKYLVLNFERIQSL